VEYKNGNRIHLCRVLNICYTRSQDRTVRISFSNPFSFHSIVLERVRDRERERKREKEPYLPYTRHFNTLVHGHLVNAICEFLNVISEEGSSLVD
jgi:hypothetical protein